MTAKVTEIGIPCGEDICLRAYQVEYLSYSGVWRVHSVHQDERIANYIKELLEKDEISVPMF